MALIKVTQRIYIGDPHYRMFQLKQFPYILPYSVTSGPLYWNLLGERHFEKMPASVNFRFHVIESSNYLANVLVSFFG